MKVDLQVIGQGAVSPAGIGVKALFSSTAMPTQESPLGHPDERWPVRRVDAKDSQLVRWQKEPRLRRASPITYLMVEAAEQALADLSAAERAETGLVVAFSAGCLVYSRRFYGDIVAGGQRRASPALFPETVFNSPVSHVATVLGLNGAAYALAGDDTAWVAALKTATIWLRQKRVRQVLVMGAEEFDPLVLDAYRAARWLRRGTDSRGFAASEGAAAILVRLSTGEGHPCATITLAHDGFTYRTRKELGRAARDLYAAINPAIPFYPTASRNWLHRTEAQSLAGRAAIDAEPHPYIGEAFTTSAGWNTLRAAACLDSRHPQLLLPIWGLNHQLGALELALQI